MQSPRFDIRLDDIRQTFEKGRLASIWGNKVRHKMRSQIIPDPIEYLDVHLNLSNFCDLLHTKIIEGRYRSGTVQRIFMEKSKGLCRQIAVPNVEDAVVLQCLSDTLYVDIKGQAPSKNSFFEPDDHSFSNLKKSLLAEPEYGSFRAWLNFQKAVFKFPELCPKVGDGVIRRRFCLA